MIIAPDAVSGGFCVFTPLSLVELRLDNPETRQLKGLSP